MQNNTMKKLLKGQTIIAIVIALIASFVFVSCDKDDDDPRNEQGLIGTWVKKNLYYGVDYTICFRSDGSGWMELSDEGEHFKFVYTASEDRIYFFDEYDDWVCTYSIKGNQLTVYGNLWGEDDDIDFFVLTRK